MSKLGKEGHKRHFWKSLIHKKTKSCIVLIFSNSKEAKRGWKQGRSSKNENGCFREKVSDFSLDLRQIRPSAVFGTRRRTTLHGEGFAWVPDL